MKEIQKETENLIRIEGEFKSPKDGWVAMQKLDHTDYVQSVMFNLEGEDEPEVEILKPKKRIISLREKIMIKVYKAINSNKILYFLYLKFKNGIRSNGPIRVPITTKQIVLNNPLNKFNEFDIQEEN